jgi:murein DD-endopeptidase MepM/ murein hydrolase activator NlpD
MSVNNIHSSIELKAGQKLIIPASKTSGSGSFLWPVEGKVISHFGENINNSTNDGIGIQIEDTTGQVRAADGGKVIFSNRLKGWGQTIILQHTSGFYTVYANLDRNIAEEGAIVKKQQPIGQVASGNKKNCVLHFEIRKCHVPQDPLKYLN